jgi:phospholipase/lecithinase/hemolysin
MKLLSILSLLLLASVQPAISSLRRYDAIFNFGDSFSDTGNNIVVYAENSLPNPAAQPPYGMTFFGRPTGRNSNGRLIIDFVAKRLRLPLVPPFLSHNGSFSQGANFAVSGATALNVSFFKDIPIASQIALNTTSSVQLQWLSRSSLRCAALPQSAHQRSSTSHSFSWENLASMITASRFWERPCHKLDPASQT